MTPCAGMDFALVLGMRWHFSALITLMENNMIQCPEITKHQEEKKIAVVTTNHREDNSIHYTLDISNESTTVIFESIDITEAQANAMILAGFQHEDSWD
jgi:hypothetical protein